MRYRFPLNKKTLTLIGGALLVMIGLVMGEGEQSGQGNGDSAGNAPPPQPPPEAQTTTIEEKPRKKVKRKPARKRRPGLRVYVSRVVDGDTIEVTMPDGRTEDVRYIGVDTPETVDPGEPDGCFGKQASRFNESLVEGRRVRLVFDEERRDYYGRLLAYVYVGGRFVNASLLRRGFARAVYYSPNGAFRYRFEEIARRAGSRGRGLWGACR